MDQITLATSEAPEITIESVGGDLRVTGWEQNEFQAESDDDHSLQAEQHEGRLTLNASADCTVRVPRRAALTIRQVGGDARLKALEGAAAIQTVVGGLVLRQTGSVTVGQVGGDVSAKKIRGALTVHNVGGDLSARSVAGDFSAAAVGGDLYLRDAGGSAHAPTVGGDTILGVAFQPGQAYAFQAGGDILCRVPAGLHATLTAAYGGEVTVDVPGAHIAGNGKQKVVTLGDGSASVQLQADGDVAIAEVTADPEALGEFGEHFGEEFGVMAEEFAAQIESQIESQMADLEKQITEKLGGLNVTLGASGVKAEQIAARARRAAERAREAAQHRAEATQRRAQAKGAGRKWRSLAFEFDSPRSPRPPAPPRPPSPPSEPISDVERMTILRMVEQKKISVTEAEKLLAALEGKG